MIVRDSSWFEANGREQSLLDERTVFLRPFDNPRMWAGHATLIDEVVEAGADFDAVVLSVSGGGLLAGIVEGLDRNDRGNTSVIAVETIDADSLAHAVAAGRPVSLPAITQRRDVARRQAGRRSSVRGAVHP